MQLTYQEAYNKIIDAYFKDEIEPFDDKFCFCGTLSPDSNWAYLFFNNNVRPYTMPEYAIMEKALLETLVVETFGKEELTTNRPYCNSYCGISIGRHRNYEHALFKAMSAALEVLKEIHRSRGEDVDGELTPFTKRQLQHA